MAADGNEDQAACAAEDEPVEVPPEALSPATLRSLIEAFVSREGTDYGAVEMSLEEKVADVRRQIDRGEARVVFDPRSRSATVVPSTELRGRRGTP